MPKLPVTSTLKVLQLGTSGPLYGAERWILALMRHLDPQLVESHIAVIADEPGAPVPLMDQAVQMGFSAHAITAQGRANPAAIRALRALIVQHGFHIIHTHGYKADVIALLAVHGTSAKTLATPHGWSRNAGWKLRFYEWLDRQSFRLFDAVAPLSPELARGLQDSPALAPKIHLIPNGVDLAEIDSTGPVPDALQQLKQRGPVIGYAGQLIVRKDLPTLLRAFARWNRADASLVLVGDGDQRDALATLADDLGITNQTHFAGFRTDRLEWMRGFDAFVLPSHEEGIPRCLMEAMALRVPIIASDIPGNVDLITPGQTGQLFPICDVDALTRCFDTALNASDREAQTEAARELIATQQNARVMAIAYERLFADMVR